MQPTRAMIEGTKAHAAALDALQPELTRESIVKDFRERADKIDAEAATAPATWVLQSSPGLYLVRDGRRYRPGSVMQAAKFHKFTAKHLAAELHDEKQPDFRATALPYLDALQAEAATLRRLADGIEGNK